MILRPIITLLMFCCLSAHATNNNIELQNNHPERYAVVKGDTLWGISAKFLKDPWQWPKVWKMNKAEISNPHLIYPGDLIILDTSSGTPQLRLLKESTNLSPDVRVEPLNKEAIPSIAPQVIAPFLNRPLVIENNGLDDAPTIIASNEERVVLSHGSKIYIDQVDKEHSLHWHIYRAGKAIVDPDTKAILGTEAHYLGDAKILKFGAPASAEITRAKEEIFTTDKLIEAQDEIQPSLIPRAPETKVSGKVLSIYGGLEEAGSNSIVAINLGKSDGIEEGHVLSINHIGRYVNRNPKDKKITSEKIEEKNTKLVKLPNERTGLVMIFRTFERVSYGLIMQASEPISKADLVETPE